MNDETRTLCGKALAALAATLQEPPSTAQQGLEQALCCLLRVRDASIERLRTAPTEGGDTLKRVNAVLSLIVGCEYPVNGIRRDKIEHAREALAAITAH